MTKKTQLKKGNNLTKELRIQALYEAKITSPAAIHRRIKNTVKCSLSTVEKIVQKIKKGESLARKVRSDKGSSSLNRFKAQIVSVIKKSDHADSSTIKNKLNLKQSRSAIRKFIQYNKIAQYSSYQKSIPLSADQKKARKDFGKMHSEDDISLAIFDDESKFQTFTYLPKTYSLPKKRKYKMEVKHPYKINGWLAISLKGRSQLHLFKENMTGAKYKEICQRYLIPFVKKVYKKKQVKLYQDNDPKHRTKTVIDLLKQHGINRIKDWPSNSPDLNPVENIWAIIKYQIKLKNPKTEKSLITAIKTAWKNLSQNVINSAINSWNKRCRQLFKLRGEMLKY